MSDPRTTYCIQLRDRSAGDNRERNCMRLTRNNRDPIIRYISTLRVGLTSRRMCSNRGVESRCNEQNRSTTRSNGDRGRMSTNRNASSAVNLCLLLAICSAARLPCARTYSSNRRRSRATTIPGSSSSRCHCRDGANRYTRGRIFRFIDRNFVLLIESRKCFP